MKLVIFSILVLLLATSASAERAKIKAQSCSENQYASWYFNGQQCMQCYSYDTNNKVECHECTADGACTSNCQGNYGTFKRTIEILKHEETKATENFKTMEITYCRKCGDGQAGKNCCFMDSKIQRGANFGVREALVASKGFHWTDCLKLNNYFYQGTEKKLHTLKHQIAHYGSICHFIDNCKELTEFGRCKQCLDGYYVNEHRTCSPCYNRAWPTYPTDDAFFEQEKIDADTKDAKTHTYTQHARTTTFPANFVYSNNLNTQVCVKCEGPSQCSTCGTGYYLSSNHNRERYDTNIAKNASFCRPCNRGCICDDASELCKECEIKGTWYKDTIKNECFPCREAAGNDREYCNTCTFFEELNLAVCDSCIAETDDSNVLALPMKRFINRDTGEHFEVPYKKCKPCHEIYSNARTNKRITVEMKSADDNVANYSINMNNKKYLQNDDLANEAFDNTKNFDSVLIIDTEHTVDGSKITRNDKFSYSKGCAKCSLKEAFAYRCAGSTNQDCENWDNTSSNSSENLYYITCDTCDNGYVKEYVPGFALRGYHKEKTGNNDNIRFWQVEETHICQRCQYALNRYDTMILKAVQVGKESATQTKYANELSDMRPQREQLVRRCSVERSNNFLHKYTTTQCGSYKETDNYINKIYDSQDRGLTFFKNKGTFASQVAEVDVRTYFNAETEDKDELQFFKVDLSSSVNNSADYSNVCVFNINKCRVIKPITSIQEGYTNTDNSSPMTTPRCESCFPGYVMTEASTCRYCPINDVENQVNISKGCSRCAPKISDKEKNPVVLEEGIKCIDCRNNQQCLSQGPRNTANQTDQQARVNTSLYKVINYYYDPSDTKCYPCNAGCLDCEGRDKKCTTAQHYWRMETSGENATFKPCEVDYCRECDTQIDLCDECAPGYTRYSFFDKNGEELVERHECAKCQKGCTACEIETATNLRGRQKCTDCDRSAYYLDKTAGVCKIARDHCLNWEFNGGKCLQCENGYRLKDGWCNECFDQEGGFIYCPSNCDSASGFSDKSANCRSASQIEEDNKNEPKPEEPEEQEGNTSRILRLLDELEGQN